MVAKRKVNYRKELEEAAKQMILVHDLDDLTDLILSTIIRVLGVGHVALLLYDRDKGEYIANVSRGKDELKIPKGFVKVTKKNPLARYFNDKEFKAIGFDYLDINQINSFLKACSFKVNKKLQNNLQDLKFQFSLYKANVCIPGFFRDKLICMLFLGKKPSKSKLTKEEIGFLLVLTSDVVMAIQNAWFYADLNKQLQLNRKLFLQTVMALATAIEAKDKYTLGHTERVSKYSLIVAQEIRQRKKRSFKNWKKFIEDLRIASVLHDIGKIGIPESILNKKGALTPDERKKIEQHPIIGFSILRQIDKFEEPILGVKHHHERHDGNGYPEGKAGEEIPLIAQIISVVDAFDAINSDRPYRVGLPKDKAISIIKKDRGKQFSPKVVDAFLSSYKKGKI